MPSTFGTIAFPMRPRRLRKPAAAIVSTADQRTALACRLDQGAGVLPPGPGPHQIVPEHHAGLVTTLDQGGRIALLGTHDSAICEAIQAVLALVGGGHG